MSTRCSDNGAGDTLRGLDDSQELASSLPSASARKTGREAIKVLVRIRPLLKQETGPVAVVVGQESNVLRVNGSAANRQLRCCYDAVIGPEVSQDGMFSHVRECTSAVLEGENSTIFAYGQTGSGKTYTMFGPDLDAGEAPAPGRGKGVIPLAVTDLFKGLARNGKNSEDEYSVWVSLVQLYNEQLYDMLRDPQRVHPLAIHEQPEAGIYVQGLSEYAVHGAAECLQLLRVGREHRAIRETHMNQASSRSHSILQIVVEQKRRSEQDGERILRSKFNLVDLAGSEKWDIKQDMEEVRVSEMTNINVSLYTLGRVIAALSTPISNRDRRADSRKERHIPYRDSKLTRLLQDSLGGNTRTRIIATLSPASECIEETISTLRFADRAKQVMAFVRVNERRPVDHALVQRLQAEVTHLRGLLRNTTAELEPRREDFDGVARPAALTAMAEAQLLGYQETIEQLRRENTALRENVAPRVLAENPNHAQLGSDMAALQAANRALEEALAHVVGNVRRFFRFEIEEEDLRADLTRVLDHVSGSTTGSISWGDDLHISTSPLQFATAALQTTRQKNDKHDLARLESVNVANAPAESSDVRAAVSTGCQWKAGEVETREKQFQEEPLQGKSSSLPPVPGVATDRERGSDKLAYRLRGKHADEVVMVVRKEVTEEDEERRLRKELKLAKDRMKKNLQLHEWLLQKEQREMEVLASESAKRSEIDRERRKKDEDFRRRAAKQKAKLKRFYETAQLGARKEAEQRDHELLHGQGGAPALSPGNPGNAENDATGCDILQNPS